MNHQQQMNTVATKFATFCEATEAARTELKVPGVAVGILVEGEELTAGFGVTNVNHPLPVDADTLFQIGSTTKTLTATVAMQFVEAGKLELDRPVRDYVPSLELADPEVTAKVTLRHLFTHTGGWIGDFFIDTGRGDDALQRYVTRTKELRQEVPLGEAFVYNNVGLGIASYVIQEVGGKSYEQLVKEMLLDPLGMEMSFFFPEDVMIHRFAVGHSTPAEGEITVAKPWPIPRAANGQGGLSASVRDQLRYARFHMGDGKTAEGKELLSTAMLKQMQEPQVKIPFGGHIGISWFIRHIGELRVVGHGGATLEQYSAFQFAPEQDFAFVLTTNSTWGGKLCGLMWKKALQIFFDLAEPEPDIIKLSPEELGAYLGSYESVMGRIEVTKTVESLILAEIPKGGFPLEDSPPLPAPPPCPFVFIGHDQIEAREGSLQGVKGEFARRADGSIRWLHIFGRIHHRVDP